VLGDVWCLLFRVGCCAGGGCVGGLSAFGLRLRGGGSGVDCVVVARWGGGGGGGFVRGGWCWSASVVARGAAVAGCIGGYYGGV